MFDKLIESNSEGAEFKNRRSYFMASTVVVGLLFLAAVVASIYAGEIGVGNADFDLSELLAPVEMAAVEPEPSQPQTAQPQIQQSDTTTRTSNTLRTDETPLVPTTTSVVPNTQLSRPYGPFETALVDSGPSTGTIGRNYDGEPGSTGLTVTDPQPKAEQPKTESDPPEIKPHAVRPPSLGVINGKASFLPKPAYPAPAIALNVQGKVDVQVTIDESGKVISAKAVSGHPLLCAAAEKAAWGARFTPTLLSKVPVKVTGVIVYNFMR